MLYTHLLIHSASQRHNIKDRRMKENAWRKTQEDFFNNILPLILLQGFESVVEGLHVRGCWRPNINFIFWHNCYDRHVVSFLFSWCWGLLHRGFPRAPSVGCDLPYHIWSLLSGSLLATASGVFRVPPRSGVAFLTTSGLYCLEFYWQLHRGFSECPLGRVWPSLPHLVSTVWKSAGNCFGTPNSTELNNNSTPTRSPTGSLKSNV